MYLRKTVIASGIAMILAGTSTLSAESLNLQNPVPIEAMAMIEEAPSGFFVSAPIIENMTVMIVRVFNQQGEPILNIRSTGEPVELLAVGLDDGEYYYQVKILYQLNAGEMDVSQKPVSGMNHDTGSFIILNNEIIQPTDRIIEQHEELGLIHTGSNSMLTGFGNILNTLVPSANAADVSSALNGDFILEDSNPTFRIFHNNDTTTSTGREKWWQWTYYDTDSAGSDTQGIELKDGLNNNTIIDIRAGSGNADTLDILGNGDISWAGSSMYLDRSEQQLAIGSTLTPSSFNIYAPNPDILFHNEMDNDEAEIQLTLGVMQFRGLPLSGTILTDIMSYHTNAPADSLEISGNGDVKLGAGFYFKQNGSNPSLNIGGNTASTHGLQVIGSAPDIFLQRNTVSGAGIEMKSDKLAIHMDADGDGITDTSDVLTIHKSAPTGSFILEDDGDIQLGTGFHFNQDATDPTMHIGGNSQSNSPILLISAANKHPNMFLLNDGSAGADIDMTDAAFRISMDADGNGNAETVNVFSIHKNAPTNSFKIGSGGNLGLGVTDATESLDVQRVDAGARLKLTSITSTNNEGAQMVWRRARSNAGVGEAVGLNDNLGAFSFRGHDGAGWTGSRGFINVAATENWAPGANGTTMIFQVTPNGSSALAEVFRVNAGELRVTGNVVVNGTTLNVPDYVFEEDYTLMTLDQLSAFIGENKHLPGVASAKYVNSNGLDLAGSQLSILEKVEELTLYTLQQHQEIGAINDRYNKLEAENIQLKSAHRELLAAYDAQQQNDLRLELLIKQVLENQQGKSIYTSLK